MIPQKPTMELWKGLRFPENRISFVDEETRVFVAAPQGGVGKWTRMYYLEGKLWGKSRSDCSLPSRSNVIHLVHNVMQDHSCWCSSCGEGTRLAKGILIQWYELISLAPHGASCFCADPVEWKLTRMRQIPWTFAISFGNSRPSPEVQRGHFVPLTSVFFLR